VGPAAVLFVFPGLELRGKLVGSLEGNGTRHLPGVDSERRF
jgi:hypothetical protein